MLGELARSEESYQSETARALEQFCPRWNIPVSHRRMETDSRLQRHTEHRPWKRVGVWPRPFEKANVHTASADLSEYAARRLFKPSCPIVARNHLLVSASQHRVAD